jgi:ATP-dependent Clp protease adaptor protein ClpS
MDKMRRGADDPMSERMMAESNSITSQVTAPKTKPGKRPPGSLPPYNVVLLDDQEHSYEYVIDMLQALFFHNEGQAFQLAFEVDHSGRAIVCTTHKERAELKHDQILAYGCDFRISSSKSSMRAVVEPAEQQ